MSRPGQSPRLLVSAFEPFGGRGRNASQVALEALAADPPPGAILIDLLLPVETEVAAARLVAAIDDHAPHAVICLGEARRDALAPERVALNERRFSIPDNAGRVIAGRPVVEGGPGALRATLPVEAMVAAMRAAGAPARASDDAGRYLCNEVMYAALHHGIGRAWLAGFVHVPLLVDPSAPPEGEGTGAAHGAAREEPGDAGIGDEAPGGTLDVALTIRGVRAALGAVADSLAG